MSRSPPSRVDFVPSRSNGELFGSGSNRAEPLVLGAAAAAGADRAERTGRGRVRAGEVAPEHRQCEFPIVCLTVS